MTVHPSLALAALATLLPRCLAAQASRDTVTLRPLVVTANRVPLPADAVSASVTVIRGQDLVVRGVRTVADALRDVLGAAVAQAGAEAQTSLSCGGARATT
jgi:outer membrane cobalamin receptor